VTVEGCASSSEELAAYISQLLEIIPTQVNVVGQPSDCDTNSGME
jgi:hypothetical protein